MVGGENNDDIMGDHSDDTITDGVGDDVVHGSNGTDDLNGNAGADFLHGGKGDDLLIGGHLFDDAAADLDDLLSLWTNGDVVDSILSEVIDDDDEDHLFGNQGNDRAVGGWKDKIKA